MKSHIQVDINKIYKCWFIDTIFVIIRDKYLHRSKVS